ncbi:MAG: penicillin-binding transpeptidase domain-containing protein [Gemmatimonadales bacterium]
MAKAEVRIGALAFCLLAGCAAMLGRAGYLQLVEGAELAAKAKAQRTVRRELEPHRGTLYDRHEVPLALSFERYHLGVNPDRAGKAQRDTILRFVRADLGISTKRLDQAFDAGRYFYTHGPYSASQVERLRRFRAVELVSTYRRSYPLGALARPLIGSIPVDSGVELTGLERFLDPLLRGEPGEAVLLRAADRREYESPGRVLRRPVAGHDVFLTIDRELQEIAEAALVEAFAELDPDRGDIVFLDPRSGELLAAASRVGAGRDSSGVAAATFFWNYFEPGSTAKPFTAAALLELEKVNDRDTVSGEDGEWWPEGRQRPIRDDHPQKGPITLQRAVEVSSNVGMAKFASRLSPVEHYDVLRRFGFGTPTGIEYTAERGGVLPRPAGWRKGQQGFQRGDGYAFEVTPIQLAAAQPGRSPMAAC